MLRGLRHFFRGGPSILYRLDRHCYNTPAYPGTDSKSETMDLKKVTRKLNKFAPTTLASSWDNVGLLVEPTPPHKEVTSLLITNDLTEPVMTEALEKKVDVILSYHPPIFSPLKRLTQRSWKERIIVKCIENRIAVYSPHTSYDAIEGGVNDWLLKPFVGVSKPIEKVSATQYLTPGGYRVELTIPKILEETAQKMLHGIEHIPGVKLLSHNQLGDTATRLTVNCTEKGLEKVVQIVKQFDAVRDTVEILQLVKPVIPNEGYGRLMTLETPITLAAAVEKTKAHLELPNVRLAKAVGATTDCQVKVIAVCAGSGSTVLRGITADLYITGEMSHHDILEANHNRTNVIVCDHTNTERGFLKYHKQTLEELFEQKVTVHIAETDRDPLEIV